MENILFFIKKNRNKMFLYIIIVLLTCYAGAFLYLVYSILLLNGIETTLRICFIFILCIIAFLFIKKGLNISSENSPKKYISFILLMSILGTMQFFGAYYINKAYSSIEKITETKITYSTSLIALANSNVKNMNDLKNKKIGIIDDKDSVDGYVISQEIITEYNLSTNNTIIEYENVILLLNDLYDAEIDAIFISSNYKIMFSGTEYYENISDETIVLTSKTKKVNAKESAEKPQGKILTDPFTVLIIGVDSTNEDITAQSAFNGDALLLITFNPNTLNATMLSIPRDTFVPIMCFKNRIRNKIAHAAWYGESCVISTVENFTGIDIDYYLKINFNGVVSLVEALGGIEVDVPLTFCEQNSNREWGKETICLEKGLQTLNGEEALALARHRAKIGDLKRGLNQQLVLKAILNQAKTITSLNQVYSLLGIMEKSMTTNLTTNQILSFYNVAKDVISAPNNASDDEVITFQKLFLKTREQYIYDENMKRQLSNQIYYTGSLTDVVKAMKVNLGITEPEPIKAFSFSIKSPYETTVIGEGSYYGQADIQLVPDFKKYSKQDVLNWGSKNNVKITVDVIDSSDTKYSPNEIIEQNVPANSLMSSIKKDTGIVITIVNKISQPTMKVNCTLEENDNNSLCSLPDFVGEPINKVEAWINSITSNFIVTKKAVTSTESSEYQIVFEQSISAGTKVTDMGPELVINYYIEEESTSVE